MPNTDKPIRRLTGRLDLLIRGRLWLQVVIGLVAGLGVGIALGPSAALVSEDTAASMMEWLSLPGVIFLGLIGMVLALLVSVSIVRGLAGASSMDQMRTLGMRLAVFIAVTTALAATIGITLGVTLEPGRAISVPATQLPGQAPAPPESPPVEFRDVRRLVTDLIPRSPERAMVNREMLPLVIFSILVGIACAQIPRDTLKPLLDVMDALLAVCMTIVKWAMFLAPWAVFGLTAQLAAQVGLATLAGMALYVATVLAGLIAILGVYLVLVAVIGRRSPIQFMRDIGSVQLLAFSTSSSAAVMPLSMQVAEEKLGAQRSAVEFLIPLGATVNMAGTALYQSVAVVFLAQVAGVELSTSQYVVIVLTVVGSSIGSPGAPGVSMAILAMILSSVGIPAYGIVLVFGVDRVLDMARTTVNVTGDLAACVILPERSPAPVSAHTEEG